MANYRNITDKFWTDGKVDEDFTPEDKYFFLYLLTNPHTNICGCFEITFKQMKDETGYSVETIAKLIDRMEKTHDVIRYDSTTKEILVINWSKYNWSTSPNLVKAVKNVASHIKSNAFRQYIMDKVDGTDNRLQITDTDYSTQITDNRLQITDTDYRLQTVYTDTDVGIGYEYPMDRVLEQNPRIDYQKIITSFNQICVSYPKVKSLSEARKKTIRARLNTYTEEQLIEAFEMAEASDFMKGKNDRNWSANFDWIIADKNIAKILDGNYANDKVKATPKQKETSANKWLRAGGLIP